MQDLSIRQFLILKTLNENRKSMSSNDLCSLLNISPRTLRYEVKDINDLVKAKIIQSDKNGYSVVQTKETEKLIGDMKINNYLDISRTVTLKLLISKEVSVYDLAEDCFVSESTVFNIVKQLNAKFNSFDLKLIKKGELLHIEGKEHSKRRMLSHFFFAEVDSLASQLRNYVEYFSKFELIEINNFVNESLKDININIDTIYFKNIVISLAVSLQRISDGWSVDENDMSIQCDKNSNEYIFLSDFLERANKDDDLVITKGDFKSMMSFIAGSFRNNQCDTTEEVENSAFKNKIRNLLEYTFSHFNIDGSYEEFFNSFVLHVHYLLLRSQKNAFFHGNKDLSLQYTHPYIYDVGIYLTYLLETEFETQIHSDEIDLIAIYMGTIIKNTSRGGSKVICICPKYNEIRKMFINQILEKFGDKIDIVAVYESYSEIKMSDKYDFIITVVKREYILSNVVYVSPLLTPREVRSIENRIIEVINNKKAKEMKDLISKYFDPHLFFYNYPLEKGEDILEFINSKMLEYDYVPVDFLKSVYKREALASSAFFNRFSIPHALDCRSNETKIGYFYSEKPIDWFGEKVNLVLLLSFKEYDENFTEIYNLLFDILLDNNMYQDMIMCKSLEELIEYVSARI